jgi:glycosyltransferase involved in cell wall biosynthesis
VPFNGNSMNRRNVIQLSVVSPVYNAADCLDAFVARVGAAVSQISDSYEIVLVDDGSVDESWKRIEAHALGDPRLCGVRLSRNFGQHLAIAAGLSASRGSLVVVMDCDLQDPPELIGQLVRKAEEGFDVVTTIRRTRSASLFRRVASRAFYFLANLLASPHVRASSNTLSVLNRRVVDAYLRTYDRFSPYPFIVNWLGFRSACVEIDHAPRVAGRSSYTLGKLLSFAVNGLVSQSTRLLHISTVMGLLFSLLSVGQMLFVVYLKLTRPMVVPGWASVMAVLWLVGGTILFSLGVIGLYLTRLFEQTRDLPMFVIGETTLGESDVTSVSPVRSERPAGSRLFEHAED